MRMVGSPPGITILLESVMSPYLRTRIRHMAEGPFADAIKAIGKTNERSDKTIGRIQGADLHRSRSTTSEGTLKELTPPRERHRQRREHVKPLVDAFFAWAKQEAETDAALPKGEGCARVLSAAIHQEKYLRVFLDDGEVPIDNSAAERAIRPFTVGRKN